MSNTLDKNEQVLLFLNRRGYASVMLCEACGDLVQCPHCSVSLTFHRHDDVCLCHMCGYRERPRPKCLSCNNEELFALGIGTERVEAEVSALFPNARVARLDRDVVKNASDISKVLARVQRREIDVIIGTQMEGPEAHALETITRSLAEKMRTRARDDFEDGTWNILGPAPCAIEKIRDRVRYQIFVLTQSMKMRAALLDVIDEDVNLQRDLDKNNCRLILDVDPLRML